MDNIRSRARKWLHMLPIVLLAGCASFNRSCASCNAENFGADWVVVQMDMNGYPYRCWELTQVSITNEEHSDGIYWKESTGDNLVHLSGHYNRVQVVGGNWERAFAELGISREICTLIQSQRFDPTTHTFTKK